MLFLLHHFLAKEKWIRISASTSVRFGKFVIAPYQKAKAQGSQQNANLGGHLWEIICKDDCL